MLFQHLYGLSRGVDNLWEVGGLSLYKASGSNLRMVRPSLICVRKVCGKILNLASYLAVRRRSHFTSVQTGGYHYFVFLPCKESQVWYNLEKTRFFVLQPTLWAREASVHCAGWKLGYVQQAQQVRLNWCMILHVYKNRTDKSTYVQFSQWVCCT